MRWWALECGLAGVKGGIRRWRARGHGEGEITAMATVLGRRGDRVEHRQEGWLERNLRRGSR